MFGLGAGALVLFFLFRYFNKKKAEREAAAAVAGSGAAGGAGGAGGAYLSPEMANAPAGYAPAPNYGGHYAASGLAPPSSTSPQAPSELYDAPYSSHKDSSNTSYSGTPPPLQQRPVVSEMAASESRYEMA